MKKYNKLGLVVISLLLVSACARQRPPEELKGNIYPEGDWIAKEPFVGTGEKPKSWFFRISRVSHSANDGFVGIGLPNWWIQMGHFEIEPNKLQFINDVSRFKKSNNVSMELLSQWDITHHDNRFAESDGKVTNKREEDQKGTSNSVMRDELEKRYMKIDFENPSVGELGLFNEGGYVANCWNKVSSKLDRKSVTIKADYLSWILESSYVITPKCKSNRRSIKDDFTYTIRELYSFKLVEPSDYKPYVFKGVDDPIHKRYGFLFPLPYETTREDLGSTRITTLMPRWDPNKIHHFYLASNFPEEYKWIWNNKDFGVFARTNKLIEEGNKQLKAKGKPEIKARFYIHENMENVEGDRWASGEEKLLGDLRYNIIQFVTEEQLPGPNPLAWALPTPNPITGELINGSIVFWTGYYKKEVYQLLEYLKQEDSQLAKSALFDKMKDTKGMPEDKALWATGFGDYSKGVGKAYFDVVRELNFRYPGYALFTSYESSHNDDLLNLDYIVRPEQRVRALLEKAWSTPRAGTSSELAVGISKFVEKTAMDFAENQKNKISELNNGPGLELLKPTLPTAIQVANAVLRKGVDLNYAIDASLYRTSIHEFGHILGLAHNFEGTVDVHNFPKSVPLFDKAGKPLKDDKGKPVMSVGASASVMDYINFYEEIYAPFDWDPYDQAAILYILTDGELDSSSERNYLYCNDRDVLLNAVCNRYDSGVTPSEIFMSKARQYDFYYKLRNNRLFRSYWDPSAYARARFEDMLEMKQFLSLWLNGWTTQAIKEKLQNKKYGYSQEEVNEYTDAILDELAKTQRNVIAFYNGVIQQGSATRSWRDEFDPMTGELVRIGILPDKVFAMRFLMGNEDLEFNFNKLRPSMSFLNVASRPEIAETLETVLENTLTIRPDMQEWFLGYGQALYALTAKDVYNVNNPSLINKMKIERFTPKEMKEYFGDNVFGGIDTDIVTVESSIHPYFLAGKRVGVMYSSTDNHYYVASEELSPYSFSLIQQVNSDIEASNESGRTRQDVIDLYLLYDAVNN